MYEYVFKYLNKIINNKETLIYGNILLEELSLLNLSNKNISIVDSDVNSLIKLKSQFPELSYNQSLYFVDRLYDILIILTDSPINPKDYVKDLGVLINIQFIKTDEDYHKLILTEKRKDFEYLERVNLYKKEVVISLLNGKEATLTDNNLFTQTPNVLLEFYSNYKIDLNNSVDLI
jgi:hypothetical protein